MIYDILSFFLWEAANLFFEPAFVNHHNMGTLCEALNRKVCLAFSEQYVSWKVCMFCLFGEWSNYDRLEFTSVAREKQLIMKLTNCEFKYRC